MTFEIQDLTDPLSFINNPFTKHKYKKQLETQLILNKLKELNRRLTIIESKLQTR